MNSGPDVALNLGVAGQLLADAAAAGAVLAVLPENFAIMGAKEADRLAVAASASSCPATPRLRATSGPEFICRVATFK